MSYTKRFLALPWARPFSSFSRIRCLRSPPRSTATYRTGTDCEGRVLDYSCGLRGLSHFAWR